MKLHQLFARRRAAGRGLTSGSAKSRPNFARKSFFVEPLEGRSLLAGNVLASIDQTGMLNLTGDAQVNNVSISYDATAGAYVVSGVNTTINGGTSAVDLNALALLATGAAFHGGMNVNLGWQRRCRDHGSQQQFGGESGWQSER